MTTDLMSDEREGLPEGWAETTLGAICSRIVDGSHNPPKAQINGIGLPMLSAKNIQRRQITFDGFRALSHADFESENMRTQVKPGDVLLTIVGAIGRTAVVQKDSSAFTLQRSVAVLKTAEIHPYLLSYFLESPTLQQFFEDNAKGTAQKGIYLKALSETALPLPPLPEQIRIANKLDALLSRVEAGRERLERVPGLLKRFRQSVLSAAVSGELTREWRGGGDAEWERVTVGDLLKSKPRNGYSPQAVDFETSVKSLTLAATTKGSFDPTKFKFIDEVIPPESHLWLRAGDILIQRANSLEHVGISAIFQGEDGTFIYPDLMMKAQAAAGVLTEFAHYVLLSEEVRAYFRNNATGTAGNMPKINQQTVITAPAVLPPLAEQAEIVRRVEALFAIADRIEARYKSALTTFNLLTPALLAKAFRGELVPQDPSDEPASVLLERIRAARAGAPKKATEKKSGGGRKPEVAEASAGVQSEAPRGRGRPPKVANAPSRAIPLATSEEDAIRLLEQRSRERLKGKKAVQPNLFEPEPVG